MEGKTSGECNDQLPNATDDAQQPAHSQPEDPSPPGLKRAAGVTTADLRENHATVCPLFGTIKICPKFLAREIFPYLAHGFDRNKVLADDLHVYVRENKPITPATTASDLIQNGTPLFDARLFLSIAESARPKPIVVQEVPAGRTNDVDEIKKALLYVLFHLVIRGEPPTGHDVTPGSGVPKFLLYVMNMREAPQVYASRIASFDLSRMTHEWIKQMRLPRSLQKAQNRCPLTIAGYRDFIPFVSATFRDDIPDNLRVAAEAVRDFVNEGRFWEVQTVTRSIKHLQNMGTPSAELRNLMLKVFDDDTIEQFVDDRLIHEVPKLSNRHQRHMSYTKDTFDFGRTPMFEN